MIKKWYIILEVFIDQSNLLIKNIDQSNFMKIGKTQYGKVKKEICSIKNIYLKACKPSLITLIKN